MSWIAVSASGASLAGQRVIASRQAFKCKDLPSWRLDKGKGDRTFKQAIKFHPADSFTQVPLVFMGFSLLDIVNEDDYRLNLATGVVEKTGLELHLSTWSETHVWSTHVSWLALDESYMRTQEVQVAVGRIPFKKTLAGYKLHEGSGNRHVHAPMMFPKKFSHTPSVVPALTLIDLLRDTPPRVRLQTAAVSAVNGTMELNTTEKGHVWGASCAWLAHAPAEKADAGGKKAKIQPAPCAPSASASASLPSCPLTAPSSHRRRRPGCRGSGGGRRGARSCRSGARARGRVAGVSADVACVEQEGKGGCVRPWGVGVRLTRGRRGRGDLQGVLRRQDQHRHHSLCAPAPRAHTPPSPRSRRAQAGTWRCASSAASW